MWSGHGGRNVALLPLNALMQRRKQTADLVEEAIGTRNQPTGTNAKTSAVTVL